MNIVESILGKNLADVRIVVKEMVGSLRPIDLEKKAESDLLVIPGFGSKQRYLAHVGNLPEKLANAFSGNLIILHFDK